MVSTTGGKIKGIYIVFYIVFGGGTFFQGKATSGRGRDHHSSEKGLKCPVEAAQAFYNGLRAKTGPSDCPRGPHSSKELYGVLFSGGKATSGRGRDRHNFGKGPKCSVEAVEAFYNGLRAKSRPSDCPRGPQPGEEL